MSSYDGKAGDMKSEEYLIICCSQRMAISLLTRVADYLYAQHVINLRVIKSRGVITMTIPSVTIRFVSEANEYEASRGFRGLIRSGYEVERFLDAWERAHARLI